MRAYSAQRCRHSASLRTRAFMWVMCMGSIISARLRLACMRYSWMWPECTAKHLIHGSTRCSTSKPGWHAVRSSHLARRALAVYILPPEKVGSGCSLLKLLGVFDEAMLTCDLTCPVVECCHRCPCMCCCRATTDHGKRHFSIHMDWRPADLSRWLSSRVRQSHSE